MRREAAAGDHRDLRGKPHSLPQNGKCAPRTQSTERQCGMQRKRRSAVKAKPQFRNVCTVCTSSTIMPDLRRWAQRKTTPPRPLGTNNPRLSLYDTQGKEFLHRVAISDSSLKRSLPPLESGEMISLSRMNPESGHPVIIPPPA